MSLKGLVVVIATICVGLTSCSVFQNDVSSGKTLFAGLPGGSMIDAILKMIIKSIQDQLTALKDEKNGVCVDQFNLMLTGLLTMEMWALAMFDAWGKIPAGLLGGNLIELGSYDECLKVTNDFGANNDLEPLRGQYCLPTISLSSATSLTPGSVPMRVVPEEYGGMIGLRIGMCTPATCSPDMLRQIFIALLNINESQFVINDLVCNVDEEVEFTGTDIFGITFFVIFAAIVAISTIYDYVATSLRKDKREVFIAFSIITNCRNLLKVNYKRSPDVMECLNGIRCLSIIWVVFGHSYSVSVFSPVINYFYIAEWIQNYFSMILATATVSVDSFFLLSGLLVSWTVLKQLDKTGGKLNVPLMYLHRYLRLTPVIIAAIIFSVSIIKYLGSGPFWKQTRDFLVPLCEEHWWTTLLYIQNYAYPDKMCLAHTWYLAVDMQLYIISPLILIPLWKWKKRFIPIMILLILLSMACTFTVFILNDFSVSILTQTTSNERKMRLTYYPTHTRAGVWLIGILLGYQSLSQRTSHKTVQAVLGFWILSLGTIGAIIWGPYKIMQPATPPTVLESAFYESLSRVCWGMALAWIIVACTQGYGGPINSFLSFPLWQPLGRLSYCIYITHMIIQLVAFGNVRSSSYLSDYTMISRFWSDFGLTLMLATITSLAFESPIIRLEKLIFNRSTARKADSQENILENSTERNHTECHDVENDRL